MLVELSQTISALHSLSKYRYTDYKTIASEFDIVLQVKRMPNVKLRLTAKTRM
jgi:hypothetical protein